MSGFRERAATVAEHHTHGALKLLDRTEEDFLHLPWADIDNLVGGISEGDIWFLGGFSGDGKTTALTSAVDLWYEAGKRIYYLGLESKPKILKTHWACKRLKLDAGEVLSGKALHWSDWAHRKAEIAAMIRSFDEGATAAQVHFSGVEFIDANGLRAAMRDAEEFGADLLVLDHIDHIEGDQGSSYEVSRAVNIALLREAQSTGIRCLVATQFNNEALRGNRAGRYLPPQPGHVFMGGHKRQIAAGMLGLYRPLKFRLDPDAMREFQRGLLEPKDVIEPNVMAAVCMKHRLFGSREGSRVFLKVDRGRVCNLPTSEQPRAY